jgi:subtilisin family serine protease
VRGASLLLAAALVAALPSAPAGARGPRTDSDEYRRSWGLEAIGARAAFEAGLTGKGVTIAIVDCGIGKAQREVTRNLSPRSLDVVQGRTTPVTDRHGSYVAGPLSAALNGNGMVGVAHKATLLAVRADVDGGLDGACAFKPSDLARAMDYAVTQRARVIVLPIQGAKPMGQPFEAALQRATSSGAIVVIAAGNRTGPDPSWPARYAVDPRFAGSIIVAGATGYYGALTSWSNRAGAVKPYYIAAPGEWVLTDCADKCQLVSGTSFSTSYVAGGLALMMEAWPNLSGREVIARILDTARDAGESGVDDVYGRGILDLTRTFAAN